MNETIRLLTIGRAGRERDGYFRDTIDRQEMSYHFSRIVDLGFDRAIDRATEELKKEGFGVLTTIDLQGALKEKLGVDFRRYRILGACNPQFAFKAVSAEDKIGTMLPCNVVVQEHGDGRVEVSAVDPVASMAAVRNNALGDIAAEVREKLARVIAGV
jgi:uncharacterized protein (DUF302 family)